MKRSFIIEFKDVLKVKLSIAHLLISSIVLLGFMYILLIVSIVISWECCLEPNKHSRLFSDFTLFCILTTNLSLLLLLLSQFYKISMRKDNLRRCKSYVILGIILVIFYLVAIPWLLMLNE